MNRILTFGAGFKIVFYLHLASAAVLFLSCEMGEARINRHALVSRHNPTLTRADTLSSFTVGNGEFAFTTDITGLQTFFDDYENGIPLGTMSQWGWHSFPNPDGFSLEQTFVEYDTYGRKVKYASNTRNQAALWLRANPHRLHLGKIGFVASDLDDDPIKIDDIKAPHQMLDMWQGILTSRFTLLNEPVAVETGCHPDLDQVVVSARSPLFARGKLAIEFAFPYPSGEWGKGSTRWDADDKHSTEIVKAAENSVLLKRTLDETSYFVSIAWETDATFTKAGPHRFRLQPKYEKLLFTVRYFQKRDGLDNAQCTATFAASTRQWRKFWQSGGAIDLHRSKDPRANELERRIVLSRYLTRVQCAGSLPPQETGLTCNSWFGKFHLEMHWWHAVHFALWGRPDLLEKSLGWYSEILTQAQQKAQRQGYDGARWPKMVGPDGRESPSGVGVFLLWQQPHPIYYAELLYRLKPDQQTLENYKTVVSETAKFMASYAHWDAANNRYVLGPPAIPAQEIYRPDQTINPPFELSYWEFGLRKAQEWRRRLGLPEIEKWNHIIEHLAAFPEMDGLYINAENAPETFTDEWHRRDHPTLLGAFGMLPSDRVDKEKMRKTLLAVMDSWNWERTWGWDYPLVAMTAARVGEPEIAIQALLMDVQKNTYLKNGHNYQDNRLTLYLPGNGGLLSAAAMMAAGWDGGPDTHAPGFPRDGSWDVRFEGLNRFP